MSDDIIARAEEIAVEIDRHRAMTDRGWLATSDRAYLRVHSSEVSGAIRKLVHDLRNERQRVLALQSAYLDETHGDRDPSTVGPNDIANLRAAFRWQAEAIRDLVPVVAAADRFRDTSGADSATAEAELDATVDVLRAKRGQP